MSDTVYKALLTVMQKRGGSYAGMDIPEFFDMVEVLFTPEQAAVNNALPTRPTAAVQVAELMGRDATEIESILESMANSGLCAAHEREGKMHYVAVPFMIGIMEFQFMRGTATDRDKKVAQAIDTYKKAYNAIQPRSAQKITFPGIRVIPVDRTIDNESTVHTYNQVKSYIENNDLITVSTCYCRQEALLLGEDIHDMPMEVCMSFGPGAQFNIDRLGAQKLTKEEAMKILDETEEAGLIHMTRNVANTNFICNCDRWHCEAVSGMLAQPKPGKFFNSGFEPRFDPDACVACEVCIDRCPATALAMGDDDLPEVDLDRCFGCAACATGCPSEAIGMTATPGFPAPPKDTKAFAEAARASREA
ncbi:MAG: hypothetical protein V3S89_09005 [Desulfobacterales bacterium]